MSKRECTIVPQEEILLQREFIRKVRDMNPGRFLKYTISTFGCQMNENDSEKLAGMLSEMGYLETKDTEVSDLVIYNTCCVRENAELKVYGHLGSLKKLKILKPDMIIAVCGCMMQQKEVVEHIRKKYRHVDLIFGTHNLYKFPELLHSAVNSDTSIIDIQDSSGTIAEGMPIVRKDGVKALITVMYGCNNFCSYCIVPYVRGRERSRNKEEIIEEARQLGRQGFKEITLLGQNVNSYGMDIPGNIGFAGLLHELENVDGIERIRFMTSHPKDLSIELINAMRDLSKVCEHLHLPVQAGSSRVLELMNRKYTKEKYIMLADAIRSQMPDIALTTDVIAGFPGETDKDFDETIDLLERVRFDFAYTFLYSKRTGTPAAKSSDQISEDVKKQRLERLMEVQNRISKEINEKLLGTEAEVLVEGLSRNSMSTFAGRTRTNKIVNFRGTNNLIGKTIKVRIKKIQTWSLEGEIIQ